MDTKLRHEFYETMTGGTSWTLRQSSQSPIPFNRGRNVADAVIRIRPDAKIHGLRIEKRQGDRWVEIAAFLVDAGACRS